eukprot:scaffold75056_cov56-Phaeocystis_antarctica.AAC.1
METARRALRAHLGCRTDSGGGSRLLARLLGRRSYIYTLGVRTNDGTALNGQDRVRTGHGKVQVKQR